MRQQGGYPPSPPGMRPRPAGPPPPGAPRPVTRLTGNSPRIAPGRDPANRYKNLERAGAESITSNGDMLNGVNKLVAGVIVIVALSCVFVLPKQLKVYWLVVVSLTMLVMLGFCLSKEWIKMGEKGGEDAKYSEWGAILLTALVMVYSAVMVGILFFMAWSLYSIANSKSNIARLDQAAAAGGHHVPGRRDGDRVRRVYA